MADVRGVNVEILSSAVEDWADLWFLLQVAWDEHYDHPFPASCSLWAELRSSLVHADHTLVVMWETPVAS